MRSLQTKRLLLRPWQEKDLDPFTALNADPKVMEYFPSLLTKEETKALIKKFQTKLEEGNRSFLAAILLDTDEFVGMIGLNDLLPSSNFPPEMSGKTEIGWRLATPHWGKGYATEGALALLQEGFETDHLPEIISFTAFQNSRSRKVMERLGMHYSPENDFDHPKLPQGHPLSRHVLYKLNLKEWHLRPQGNTR